MPESNADAFKRATEELQRAADNFARTAANLTAEELAELREKIQPLASSIKEKLEELMGRPPKSKS